jgi:SAM-dependent methyltransferase
MTSPERLSPFPQEILDWYTGIYKESARLAQGLGLVERIRIREIVQRFLPTPPAVVCDVGGGTGVHAFWLAGLGYEVHLMDIVPVHVEEARRLAGQPGSPRLASIRVGDARVLDYPSGSADAVLLFGPLYHLTERADRLRALTEAGRVLRPGGLLFAYAISRYASTMVGLVRGWVWDPDYLNMVTAELTSGQHRKPADWNVITTAYFHHPDDLRAELVEAGMQLETTVGIQGPGWMVPDFETHLKDDERLNTIAQLARMLEGEPVLSPHFLAVARRPGVEA